MDSIDYYERYANVYYENTAELNMGELLDRFLELLPENAEVLDLGCGSGRDSLYMEEAGCLMTLMDGSAEMCKLAEINTDKEVLNLRFEEMDFQEVFDGIWACASLLHVAEKDIDDIMRRVSDSLKPGGILYMSFRYGEDEEIRSQRFYHDYTEETAKEMVGRHPELEILDIWITDDIHTTAQDKDWLNVLVKKNE